MRPSNLKTKIFLDSGDPKETAEALQLLGFLDGQTTNPTLISKNPEAQEHLSESKKFTSQEIFDFYHTIIKEIAALIPQGAISIEVYADQRTPPEKLLKQAREMSTWISNAYIKFPTTQQGIAAARHALKEKMKVNMTLCFTQAQAAAVHSATKGALKGSLFISPFVGRLDDRGENGMQLIENILNMYRKIHSHVEVLTSSVRTLDHFLYALYLGSDSITAPFVVLKEWKLKGMPMPSRDYLYPKHDLKPIPYQEIDIGKSWHDFNIHHGLTNLGIERFCRDWNALIAQ